MRRLVRENAPCALAAAIASATMAWLGLYGFAWNDYDTEVRPAFDALIGGHLLQFLRLAPAYGGSLVVRAPFALLPGLWGGGALAVYRMAALPCLLAAAALGIWLCARMRAAGRSTLSRAVALGVCVANPLTLRGLELGHPEELLGACLCVAAVLLAARDRPLWAGALLGLAIANKEWALLAVGPVLLALPERSGRRRRQGVCLTGAGAVAVAVLAPLALVSSGAFAAGTRVLASTQSAIFQPWQIWWFFGHHGPLVHGFSGAPKPGYRTGPAWALAVSHPLILAAGMLLTAALWLGRGTAPARGVLTERAALLALALLLLLRCVLDTWDAVYYPLPFILALLAWEVAGPDRARVGQRAGVEQRPPVLALSSTVLAWISFQWLPAHGASADLQAAFFLAWTLALAGVLALRLFGPGPAAAPLIHRGGPRGAW